MSSRWEQTNEIFVACIKLPAAERSEFLSHACGEDNELRDQVDQLLKADSNNENHGFLS